MPRFDPRTRLAAACLAAAPCVALAQAADTPPAANVPPAEAPATEVPWSSPKKLLGLDETEGNYWRLMVSPYTAHFHKDNDGEHENVYLIGIERQRSDGWLWGAAYFSNSFGQPSGYVYVGERFSGFSRWPELYAQWTAGIVYGYVYPYKDKIPFNVGGFAPGIIVGLGWQFTREFAVQANLLGGAGMMFAATWDFR